MSDRLASITDYQTVRNKVNTLLANMSGIYLWNNSTNPPSVVNIKENPTSGASTYVWQCDPHQDEAMLPNAFNEIGQILTSVQVPITQVFGTASCPSHYATNYSANCAADCASNYVGVNTSYHTSNYGTYNGGYDSYNGTYHSGWCLSRYSVKYSAN